MSQDLLSISTVHGAASSGARSVRAPKLARLIRAFIFPAGINFWPLLLYVSQKVLVAPALLIIGFGDAAYRRDLIFSFGLSLAGLLVYLYQPFNSYRDIHFIGYLVFVWAMPPLNYAARMDDRNLLNVLAFFTLFNVALGFYFLYFNVDLTDYRGLNRIETSDGYTTRLFFESTSLAAVFSVRFLKREFLRLLGLIVVAAYVVLVARSLVVMLLLALNLAWPYLRRSSVALKLSVIVGMAAVGFVAFLYLAELRPDLYLSLFAKQYQLEVILSLQDGGLGWGWGSFIPQLSSDIDQPYQIEMQLPMLLLQVGPWCFAAFLVLTLMLFLSASREFWLGAARFAIYCAIGFNNPWLFLPSWYLTCLLLFREDVVFSFKRQAVQGDNRPTPNHER